jgi:carbonic anhydrase
MDRRMNGILVSEYNDKDTVIVRNAGANVEGLRGTLQEAVGKYGATEIHVLPHEDCGAMKAVVLKLKDDDPRIGEGMFDSLVRQFKRKYDEGAIKNNGDAERINLDIQCANAAGVLKGTEVTSRLVDSEEINRSAPSGKHVLLVLNPCRAEEYAEVFKAAGVGSSDPYVIQGRQEETIDDIKLAIQVVGIHELHFVALPGESIGEAEERKDGTLKALKNKLSGKEYRIVNDAKVEIVKETGTRRRLKRK